MSNKKLFKHLVMKQIYFWAVLSLCLSFNFSTFAITTLSPGDIVIVQYQSDGPEEFAFVTLVDLDYGTEIFFTDNGWQSNGSLRMNEGIIKYTTPGSGINAGTLIQFNGSTGGSSPFTMYIGGFALDPNGDQILVFQDSDPSNNVDPEDEPSFIFAFNGDGNWASNSNNEVNTALPPPLVDGETALSFTEIDNFVLELNFPYASRAAFEAAYRNASNWTVANTTSNSDYDDTTDDLETFTGVSLFLSGALPVEFLSFKGKVLEDGVQLNWATASETNNDYFEIQRSTDGKTFDSIDQVKGAGNSEVLNFYSFVDIKAQVGVNYYRLQQVDFDATFEYSTIISIQLKNGDKDFQIYPTVVQEELTVSSSFEVERPIEYQILNANGQVVQVGALDMITDSPTIRIQSFQKGMYYFQLQFKGYLLTKSFIKMD